MLAIAIAGFLAFMLGALATPPDPFTQLLAWPAGFLILLPLTDWFLRQRDGKKSADA